MARAKKFRPAISITLTQEKLDVIDYIIKNSGLAKTTRSSVINALIPSRKEAEGMYLEPSYIIKKPAIIKTYKMENHPLKLKKG